MKSTDALADKTIKEKEDTEEKTAKKGGLSSLFNKTKKTEDAETDSKTEDQPADEEDKPKKSAKKIVIPFKLILIILGISVAASVLLIFVFDWTGWRTSLRDNITTTLLGREKEILITRLEFEYNTKLEAATKDMLNEERAALVSEFEELEEKKTDFETRMSRLESSELQLEQDRADLEAREEELLVKIEQFESGVLEIAELGKIYESMEPQNAAKIMDSMTNVQQIVKILKTMKTDSVAAILELMETRKAADILSKLN
jgi:flagellar motility protein MotE (MotC chaperone)